MPLAVVAYWFRPLTGPILAVSGVLYTIPSLALLAFVAPVLGPTNPASVLIALVLYALLLIVRNSLAGLNQVPAEVQDAATGMGYGRFGRLLRVDLPLALPGIVTGLRLATVSTVALVTVGAIIGNGGLGDLILGGFRNNFYKAQILTATLLCVLLALVLDLILAGAGRLADALDEEGAVNLIDAFRGGIVWLNDPLNWTNPGGVLDRLGEHLFISACAVLLGCLIAWPIGLWLGHTGRGGGVVVLVSNLTLAMPTLALLTILPLTFARASARRRSSSRWRSSPSRRCSPTPTPACGRSIRRPATPRGGWACPAGSCCGGSSCRSRCRTWPPGSAPPRSRWSRRPRSRRSSTAAGSARSSRPASVSVWRPAATRSSPVGCSSRCSRSWSKACWRWSSGWSPRHRCAG